MHDAFKPFPEHHIGSYDIVHLRFFVTLLKSEDEVRGLVENLAALLSEFLLEFCMRSIFVSACHMHVSPPRGASYPASRFRVIFSFS